MLIGYNRSSCLNFEKAKRRHKMSKLKKFWLLLTFVLLFAFGCLGLAACDKGGKSSENSGPPASVDVETITFDGSVVQWKEVQGATSYIIDCNGTGTSVYSNKYVTTIGSSVNEVTIKLIAKNASGASEEVGKVFTRLKTLDVGDMRFDENGILSWAHVENATGYVVEINGKEISNGASNTFSDFSYGTSNVIRIKAVGAGNTFSTYGSSATKTYLGAPSNIRYDGETISWTGMPLALGYNLYIDGNLYASDLKGGSYPYTAQGTSFSIALQCVGDGTNTFASKISDTVTCTKLDEVRDITVESGVLVWSPVENATSYQVKLNNGSTQTTQECKLKLSSGIAYSVSIKPLAEGSDFYFSNWSANKSVYILKAPTPLWNSSLSLDGEVQNAVYWDNTENAGGYKVRVKTPSGSVESYDATVGAPHLSHAYLEAGMYEVSVSTISSEVGQYDSEYSVPLYIQRLVAPKLTVNNSVVSNPNSYEDGFTVNFQAADGANRYNVYKEGVLIGSTQNLSFSVRDLLSENQSTGGEINYKIRSAGNVGGSTIKLDSLTSNATEFVVTVLPTPTDVRMDGSTVLWNALSQTATTGYAVKTDAAVTTVQRNSHTLNSVAVGEHIISVCASGNGESIIASPYSTGIAVRKLSAPTDIRVDTSTDEGKLTWVSSPGSHGYKVYFNGSSTGIDATNMQNINNYMIAGTNGVTLVMVAEADYLDTDGTYILSSDRSQTKQFTKLSSIVAAGAVISGYELTWRTPENVSVTASGKIKYKVYTEGNRLYATVDSARLDLSNLQGRLEAYTFTIMCVGDGEEFFNSDISSPVSVTKLQEVTLSVNAARNGYEWKGVASATGYLVKINGEAVASVTHEGTGTYTLTSDKFASYLTVPGSYQVSIIAVGNPNSYIMDSSVSIVEQTVKRLTTPQISTSYSEERFSSTGNLIVTVDSAVAYANGYKYTFNGVVAGTKNDEARTCAYNAPSAGAYDIIVTANGGLFDEEGNYYMDSLTSDANRITLLDKPSADTIEVDTDNVLRWTAVSGVTVKTGYTLVITYDDGSSETVISEYASYQLFSEKEVVSVKICANGNGITTISSEYTEKRFD